MKTTKRAFKPCVWPFDSEYAKRTTCYVLKINRGKIYLRDEKHYPFTVSCGSNSERSFSGCFFGIAGIASLQQAMDDLISRNNAGKFD